MIRAILFDCDGVFVDSERAHHEAFRGALGTVDVPLSWDDYLDRYTAYDDESLFRLVFADRGRDLSDDLLAVLLAGKREDLARRLAELPPIEATCAFAEHALDEGYPVAVVSGARREEVESVLERAGLLGDVDAIVTAEDVSRGKPDPEPWLTGLARLGGGLSAADCVVIEDSRIGVAAGKAAGMLVVGLTTTYGADRFDGADLVLPDLAGLTVAGLSDRIRKAEGGG
ncbi:MAG: HAD family phosphatase [Planctomycetota bacterium]